MVRAVSSCRLPLAARICQHFNFIRIFVMASAQKASPSQQNHDAQGLQSCYENYIMVDVGANLTNKKYGRDLESVIRRAKDAGVTKIIVTGSSLKSSKEALRLTRIYPGTLYATAGIHPHDAKSWEEGYMDELRSIASNSECVAIGECGLDYSKDFSSPEVQREVFEKQITLASELKKPLLVRERDAHNDVLKILKQCMPDMSAVVIRGFAGTVEEAKHYLDLGIHLSISGYLCKDKSESGVRQLLENGSLTMDRLLVETDSPFMFPNIRSSKLPPSVKESITERSTTFLTRYCTFQRNEPCALPSIIEVIAALLGKAPEEVALATAFNALKMFGLQ